MIRERGSEKGGDRNKREEEVSVLNHELITDPARDVCVWENCNDRRDIAGGDVVVGIGQCGGAGVPGGGGGGGADTLSVARTDQTFLQVLPDSHLSVKL